MNNYKIHYHSVGDLCFELNQLLNNLSIQNESNLIQELLFELSGTLQNKFNVISDFTRLDSILEYEKQMFSEYYKMWSNIEYMKKNSVDFIKDSRWVLTLIEPKRVIAI